MEQSSFRRLNLRRGNIIKVAKKSGCISVGEITYSNIEKGREVYDYTDQYGNFSWCYGNQIIEVIR